VPFKEPFPRIRLGGLIVKDGAKMSKSRGNVVTPDDYFDEVGADVLRCALLFSAPWEQGGEFVDDTIAGIQRFFARVWRVVTGPVSPSSLPSVVDGVSEAIERLSFNVALARLMSFAPHATSAPAKRTLVLLLAPLAPHLAEELWHQLGEPFSVHDQAWPASDAVASSTVRMVVQVDGRRRAVIDVPAGLSSSAARALAVDAVGSFLEDRQVIRVVHVPDRVINLVRALALG
jgi:leucyl-tRNA synthetase